MYYDNIFVENNENIYILLLMENNYDYEIDYQNEDGLFENIHLINYIPIKQQYFKIIEHCLIQINECEKIIDDNYKFNYGNFSPVNYFLQGYNSFFIAKRVFYLKKYEKEKSDIEDIYDDIYDDTVDDFFIKDK